VPTPLLGQVVTVKLNKGNYALWRAQVLPIIRGAQLQGYLDGTLVAPEKEVNVKIADKTRKERVTRSTSGGLLFSSKSLVSS
jgi:hypothetical protein